MSKSILQIIYSSSVQKTAGKNTKFSRIETILKIDNRAKAIYSPCKIHTLGQKLKLQKHVKIHSTNLLQFFCAKSAGKNNKYSKNETILKIGHHAKAIAHAKSSLCFKNLNSKKHVKIHPINHLQLFCAKNRSKKHQILEKSDHCENPPSCKGYSPCKILTLGSKLKF